MNTTPSTTNRPRCAYTVVGGGKAERIRRFPNTCAVVILNRESRFHREEVLRRAVAARCGEIIWVDPVETTHDVESLSRQFPAVKFLQLQESVTPGEIVNLSIEEAQARTVLVLWSDMQLLPPLPDAPVYEEVEAAGLLCAAPRLESANGEVIPSCHRPVLSHSLVRVMRAAPIEEDTPTLYPFEYCGVYSKERFLSVGGYDHRIGAPFWQKLDFGLRSHLWGESIRVWARMVVRYRGEFRAEDTTPDAGYKRFFLNNVAVRLKGDGVVVRRRGFPGYALRSDTGLLTSLREYREARRWAEANQYRYKFDVRSLVNQWEHLV